MITSEEASQEVRASFDDFLRANLVAGQPAQVQQRLNDGVDLTVRSADGRREISEFELGQRVAALRGRFLLYLRRDLVLRLSAPGRDYRERKPHGGDHGHVAFVECS